MSRSRRRAVRRLVSYPYVIELRQDHGWVGGNGRNDTGGEQWHRDQDAAHGHFQSHGQDHRPTSAAAGGGRGFEQSFAEHTSLHRWGIGPRGQLLKFRLRSEEKRPSRRTG